MTASKQLYANNAKTTLTSSISTTDTIINVVDASGFPLPTNVGDYFRLTLEAAGVVEIILVYGRTGTSFTNCVRGSEGTNAAGFPGGTRIENRVTRDTLAAFARVNDRVADIAAVDLLSAPINSDSNSYICHSLEDSGNPIVAIRSTDHLWRFLTHPTVLLTGAVATSSSNSITSGAVPTLPSPVIVGQYILQFATGVCAGLCRVVTANSVGTLTWGAALGTLPLAGDQFELYRSTSASLAALASSSADEGLIYSILLNE